MSGDDLDEQLIDDVFDLIETKKLNSFFNDDLALSSSNDQIRNLFTELHEYTTLLCDSKRRNEFQNKRRKLSESRFVHLDDYLVACDVLGDYFYESLNKGKWSQLTDLLKDATCNSTDYVLKLLNKIDYGLIYSPPFLGNLLARIATLLHDYLIVRMPIDLDYELIDRNRTNEEAPLTIERSKEIRRVKSIELDDFYVNYLLLKEPLIIENAVDDWPAVRKWNLNFILSKAAYRLVPVEIGSRYTDSDWTQKVISVKEFVDQFIIAQDRLKGYLAQYELFERIERLSNDFFIPDYCALSNVAISDDLNEKPKDNKVDDDHDADQTEDVHINAWFGPSNTISPLHQDPKDNLLTQVFGSKYIRLYSPKLPDANYYLHDLKLLNNTSQVDVENVDLNKYPNFPQDYQEAILNKGETLYIPERHWHYVRSLSTSFSISFWWK